MFSPYRRAGPVNWTRRFDPICLVGTDLKMLMRYLETNPVRALRKRYELDRTMRRDEGEFCPGRSFRASQMFLWMTLSYLLEGVTLIDARIVRCPLIDH